VGLLHVQSERPEPDLEDAGRRRGGGASEPRRREILWAEYTIASFEPDSGRVTKIFAREGSTLPYGLSVSPDEQWMLFSEAEVPRSELMLVENFP